MKWNDNVIKEDNVLIPEWNGETTDDTGQNVKELSSTIEFMGFMDQ